jgi:hypothetical protein
VAFTDWSTFWGPTVNDVFTIFTEISVPKIVVPRIVVPGRIVLPPDSNGEFILKPLSPFFVTL